MIARRADTKARADFATWKMLAKLNGSSSLSAEAQRFLVRYKTYLNDMTEAQATDATIDLMYKTYYAEMGGAGAPPDVQTGPNEPVTDNVTAFRRPVPRPKPATAGPPTKLPVALIFACLAAVYVGVRYFWK
jgi:hypothetical protein